MTREQAEQIARHAVNRNPRLAGFIPSKWVIDAIMEAAAVEREACAETCLERHANGRFKHDTRDECADAIRAMGE